jgi:Ca2+-binding RTX toxin-like protein
VLLGEGFELEVGVLRDLLDNLAMGRIEFAALSVAPVGAGDDKLNGGDGFDVLIGGPGNDELRSGSGGGLLLGDGFRIDAAPSLELMPLLQSTSLSDAKTLLVNALDFDARLSLEGDGQDMIYGGSGIDLVLGGSGDDTFEASAPNNGSASLGGGLVDIIFGNDGNDTINDRAADFTIEPPTLRLPSAARAMMF